MAKLPQLSSLTPSVTPQLRGPLTLPTNFKAPVNPPGVSKALAAIAGTAENIGQFKQNLFEREQNAYKSSALNQAAAAGEELFQKGVRRIRDDIQNKNVNLRYGDGDAFLRDEIASSFSDDFFNGLEGYSTLTDKNKEAVRSNIYNRYLARASVMDNSLRLEGRKITEQSNYDNNRLAVASTSPQFTEVDGKLVADNNFSTLVKESFAYSINNNLNQSDRDTLGRDIISKVLNSQTEEIFLGDNGLSQFKKIKEAVLDLLSDDSGQSLVSQQVVGKLDDYQKAITTGVVEYKKAVAKEYWSEWEATANAGDAAEPTVANNHRKLEYVTKLITEYDRIVEIYGDEHVPKEVAKKYKDILRQKSAYNFVNSIVVDAQLPEDYGANLSFEDEQSNYTGSEYKGAGRDLFFNNAQEVLKNESVVGKLYLIDNYVTAKIANIPSGFKADANSPEETELRNLEKTLAVTKDYIQGLNGQSVIEDRFIAQKFPKNGTLYDYLTIFKEVVGVDAEYDPSTLKLPSRFVTQAAGHVNVLRNMTKEQLQSSGLDLETIEAFKIATLNNLSSRDRMIVTHGVDFGLEFNEFGTEYPNYIVDSARLFSIKTVGPKVGAVIQQDHARLISSVDASLQSNPKYATLIGNFEKAKSDQKNSAKRKIQAMLFKEVAKRLGKTYVENVGSLDYILLNSEKFPEQAQNIGDTIEVGRTLASNLAYGNAGSVIDKIALFGARAEVNRIEPMSPAAIAPLVNPQELVDLIENADWTGSHETVKAGIISAVKEGAAINYTSAVLKLKQYVEALRDSTTVAVNSAGGLYYKFKPEHGNTIITQDMSFSTISAMIGEEGQENVRLRSRSKLSRYVMRLEFQDPVESVMDIDAELDYNLQDSATIDETFSDLMENTNWANSAQTGFEESPNGVVQRRIEGDYVAIRVTGDVAEKIDFKNSSAANPRIHPPSKFKNLQNSHLLGRLFGAKIGINASQLDTPENLTTASIAINELAMAPQEIADAKSIEKYIKENDVSNLEAEWVIVAYQPELAAIEKGGFFDISEGVKTPMMTALQSRLQFKDKNTGEVKQTWGFTVKDQGVLDLMSKSQMFLRK